MEWTAVAITAIELVQTTVMLYYTTVFNVLITLLFMIPPKSSAALVSNYNERFDFEFEAYYF
jgi:hypothetical protein